MESKKITEILNTLKRKLNEKNLDLDKIKEMIDHKIEELEAAGSSNSFSHFFDTMKQKATKVAQDIKESVELGAEKVGLEKENKTKGNGESKVKKAIHKAKNFTAGVAEKFSEKAHQVSEKLKTEEVKKTTRAKKQSPKKAA